MVHVISPLRTSTYSAPSVPRQSQATVKNPSTDNGTPDFRLLFTPKPTTAAPPPSPPPPTPAPTAQSVFGPNPWLTNPTGVGPNGSYGYNPYYFATPQTAAKVAQMVGGTVFESDQFTPAGGTFAQQQHNQMVRLPDGRVINPGLVASFYDHGYSQSYIDMMIACEVKNA